MHSEDDTFNVLRRPTGAQMFKKYIEWTNEPTLTGWWDDVLEENHWTKKEWLEWKARATLP